MEILGTKGNYRLINDGCATIPYLITIEKKKYIQVDASYGKESQTHQYIPITEKQL